MDQLSLADIRRKYPQASKLSDEDLIDVVAKQYGASVDEMKAVLNYTPPAPRSRTWGEAAQDGFSAFGASVNNSLKTVTDLAGANNSVSNFLEDNAKSWNREYSQSYKDELKRQDQERAALGDNPSYASRALLAAKQVVRNPIESIGELAGNIAPMALGGAAGIGTRGMIGLSGAMGAGAVKGGISEAIMNAPEESLMGDPLYAKMRESGFSEIEARNSLSEQRASYGDAYGKILLGGGLGVIVGKFGSVENAIANMGKGVAGKGLINSVAKEVATEVPQEMAETYLGNVGASAQGAKIASDQGVIEAGVKAGILSAVGGAGAGIATHPSQKITPPENILNQPDIESVIQAAESSIQPIQPTAPAVTPLMPIDDPMRLEVINQLPEQFRDAAIRAYNIITDEEAPKGIKKQNQKLLDDILEQASSMMQPQIEDAPKLDQPTQVAPIADTAPAVSNSGIDQELEKYISEEQAKENTRVLSDIENTDSRVAFAQEQAIATKRNEIIDQILSSDAAVGMRPAKLADMVKASMASQGYANPILNDSEFARIKRFTDIAKAEPVVDTTGQDNLEGQAPSSSLSELVPEKKVNASQSDAKIATTLPDNLIDVATQAKTPTEFFKALNSLKIPLGQRPPLMAAFKEYKKAEAANAIESTAISESTPVQESAVINTPIPESQSVDQPSSSINDASKPELQNSVSSIAPTAIPATAIPETTLKDNGALSIKGDTKVLQMQLKEAGIPSLPSKDGVTVGAKNAEKAQEFISSLNTSAIEQGNQNNLVTVDSATVGPTSKTYQSAIVTPAVDAITSGKSTKVELKDGTTVDLVNMVDSNGARTIVAVSDGNVVGSIGYATTEGINPDVYVEKDFQRKGIATAMYNLAEQTGGVIPPVDTVGAIRTEDGTAFRNARAGITTSIDSGVKLTNPAQQTAAKKGMELPYKKGKTGAETARNRLAYENPFLSFLATHGVSILDRSDVGGEKGRPKLIAGHGPLFRKNGLRLDELAQLAAEKGFLTKAQIESENDNGGVNSLSDMINSVMRNEVVTTVKDVADNRQADEQLQEEAYSLGIDITGKTGDEVYDLVQEHYREKGYQEAVDILNEWSEDFKKSSQEYNLQELMFDIKEFENAEENSARGQGATSEVAREINTRGTGETESGSRSTAETPAKPAQESDAGGGDQGFRLTGETEQEASARLAKEDSDAKAKESETAKQDEADRKARIKKEIDSRQASSAENFQLGQSAEDSLSGQRDIFADNQTEAAKEQIHESDLTPAEKLANIAAVNRGDVSPDDVAKALGTGQTVESKQTEKGVALYSKKRSQNDNQEVRGQISEEVGSKFRELVKKNGDAFQFDKLTGDKDLGKTLRQIGIPTGVSALTKENDNWRDGQDQQWQIKSASGDVAYVYRKSNEVQINVSKLKSTKSKGSEIYQAVESWAFANNYKFIGDSQGITGTGQIRRTENMISSILRHDSIDHVKPHDDSKLPVDQGGLDIQWFAGNRDRSLGELLVASYKNIERVIPEIKYVHATKFGDFEYRGSPEHTDGDLFTADDIKKLADEYETRELSRAGGDPSKASRVGNNTLTRAIYTGTLYRSAVATHGAELHDRVEYGRVDGANEGIGPEGLTKTLYSRSGEASGKTVSDFAPLAKKYNDKISKNGFELVVVQSETDLPDNADAINSSSDEKIEGAYLSGNTAYIVADSISTNKRFDEVAQHELSHLATEKLLSSDEWARGLRSIQTLERMNNKTLTKLGEIVDKEQPGLDAETRAREIAALLVETGEYKNVSVLDKLVSSLTIKLKAMLRAMGLNNNWVNSLNEGEVSALLRSAMSRLYGGAEIKNSESSGNTLFSKSGNDKPLNERREKIVGDNKRERTQEQLRAFKNVGRTVEIPSLKERWEKLTSNLGKKMAQGIVDQFAPVKELDEKSYMLMRLSKGASGAFEAMLKGGQLKLSDGVYDFDDQKRGGVIDRLLVPLQGEADDFMWWVAGNRAEKLAEKGKERLFTPEDIDAFKSLADGETSFDYVIQHGPRKGKVTRNRKEAYRDSLVTFSEFNKNALDMAEQSGLIDSESRKLWEDQFYIPFYRVSENSEDGIRGMNIKSGLVRQQAFKQLKGGTDKLNSDLLENTLMNWAHLLDAAAKNRAAKSTLDAAVNMGIAVEAPEASAREMGKSIGNKSGVVWAMDGGVKRYFLVDDPYVLAALNGLEFAGMRGPLMDAMSTMKHVMTMGVTASPFFKIKNLIRDSVSAIAISGLDYNAAKNVMEGYKLTNPKGDAYLKLLAGGGTIHFGSMLEGSESKRVRKLVESGVDKSTILSDERARKQFYSKVLEPIWGWYNEIGNRGEAINRASLYDQMIRSGKTHAEASLMARDLMDFSMQGSWTSIRFLTQVVPFMNARLQGLYKLGRSAKENPRKFGVVLGAVALASIALMLTYSDDDDWKKREDWDRDNFWWFKLGGVAYRIPKPFEIGAIGTIAERGVEYFASDEMTGKRFTDRLMHLIGDNLSMNPIPQMIKPIMDVYANKDSFTGRPIETMSMERLLSEYRYNGTTSIPSRALSTTIGGALSPVQIDHMIRGYFGWLGSFIVGGADLATRPLTNEPTAATPDYWKLATGGMISDTKSASSRYVSQMYDQAKVLEEAYGTWRMLQRTGKLDEAREFAKDNIDKLRKYPRIEGIKRAESRLNELIRIVERSNLDPDVKREKINAIKAQKDRIARPASL